MRNDITTDKKQVRLPNVHLLGHNKTKAQFGDIVFFAESGYSRVGRVAGRIASGIDYDSKRSLKDYLIVIALGSNLSFTMERWLAPEEITNCYSPTSLELAERLAYFFGSAFKAHNTEQLRSWANSGSREI